MLITVAVCTWNRAHLLDRTLERMAELHAPAGGDWELLVVNNNCADTTDAVIARHAGKLPIRRLFEPKPGHSNARNCAVEAARGDLVVWTDDDVLVEPDWLEQYARAAADYPDAAYFGGTVEPWFERTPPRWVTDNWGRLSGFFAVRELGPEVRPLAAGEEVFGANMAFRGAVQKTYRYDPDRGHTGAVARGGDETDLCDRLRAAGNFGVWVGPARVRHWVPAGRVSRRYIWDYARRIAAIEPLAADASARWRGAPRWMLRAYAAERGRAALARVTGRGDWAGPFIRSARLRGWIDAHRAAAGGAP